MKLLLLGAAIMGVTATNHAVIDTHVAVMLFILGLLVAVQGGKEVLKQGASA